MLRRLSLRGRLFLLLITPLVCVAAVAVLARYQVAAQMTEELYDNMLHAVALTISRDVVISEGDVLTEQLLDELTNALGDPVYYRITGPGGSFVTGYSNSPDLPPGLVAEGGAPLFYDSTSLGRPVRAVVLREFISERDIGGWVTVEVWQTTTQRQALSREMVVQSVLFLGSLVLTAALILWFGINRGLKPLLDLRDAIGARSPDDLGPIRRWVPPELRPLVDTANSLFDRLARAFALRDAFISDAAHQLRNPVAAIQSQAEAALTAPDEAELRRRVAHLAGTARETGRMTAQLLSIERVRGRSLKLLARPVDLVALVRQRVLPFAEDQLRRDVQVGFSVAGTPQPVDCDPVLIEELVANLLDNAAKYALRAGRSLEASLWFGPGEVVLSVADDGPGIPQDLRERVFDRFFRADDDPARGCGLGLAIVRAVAEAHGGLVGSLTRADGTGCVIEVRLPLQRPV